MPGRKSGGRDDSLCIEAVDLFSKAKQRKMRLRLHCFIGLHTKQGPTEKATKANDDFRGSFARGAKRAVRPGSPFPLHPPYSGLPQMRLRACPCPMLLAPARSAPAPAPPSRKASDLSEKVRGCFLQISTATKNLDRTPVTTCA